ncbi:L-2-amino-thiazoline-4-carboxylic acid hydrolase [Bradyrhizobium sp. ma5]|uniref:L-2-amino-thiazoline-4-carboxylic acid hydrolase n=1 Tax=Bradyrhizobium sp. ma5 TaxID=3344828 RepID=UPI0035D41A9B
MPDTHDVAISHLQRRKIEGRVLIPFIQTLRDKLGDDATRELVDATIRRLAAEDGATWASTYGQGIGSLRRIVDELWAGGGAMEVQILDQSEEQFAFNVKRCGYAEFYKDLGLADIGYEVHCKRDHAMLAGFDDGLQLSRSQTLMEGALCCDFRFRRTP